MKLKREIEKTWSAKNMKNMVNRLRAHNTYYNWDKSPVLVLRMAVFTTRAIT